MEQKKKKRIIFVTQNGKPVLQSQSNGMGDPTSFLASQGYDADYLDFLSLDEKYELARENGYFWR